MRLLKLIRYLEDGMNLQKLRHFREITLDLETLQETETTKEIQDHHLIEVLIDQGAIVIGIETLNHVLWILHLKGGTPL
jgi:hypothetical protein